MTTYRLQSTKLIHMPGIVRYAQAMKPREARRLLRDGFPELPTLALYKLLEGEYTVDGETVVVTVYDGKAAVAS